MLTETLVAYFVIFD